MSGALPALFTPQSRTWLRVSSDGGRSWRRPDHPADERIAVADRLTGPRSTRPDGVNLLCLIDGDARRLDAPAAGLCDRPDGHQWHFLSFMTPIKDDGAVGQRQARQPSVRRPSASVYPRPLQLSDGRVIASIRCQRDPTGILWTEIPLWATLSRDAREVTIERGEAFFESQRIRRGHSQ